MPCWKLQIEKIMAGQPTPLLKVPDRRNKGLIRPKIKGNQWFFISPYHKGPQLFLGGVYVMRVGAPVDDRHEKINDLTQFWPIGSVSVLTSFWR